MTDAISKKLQSEIEFELEQSKATQAKKCENNAPLIAYQNAKGAWCIVQGCCNSWQCARCGQIRARHEYGRIVNGAKELDARGHQLYFVTITCRGADLNLETSDDNYLMWTNRLLSTWRARTKKQAQKDKLQAWCYVQVTERQERGAAHSHLVTCSFPDDAIPYQKGDMLPNGIVAKHDCLYSAWFVAKNVSAGLGKVCDCTVIQNPIAVAVYVSKYLFKDVRETLWPKKWRRVRYSQSWPKLVREKSQDAFPIIKYVDWIKVSNLPGTVYALDQYSYDRALSALATNVFPLISDNSIEYVEAVADLIIDEF